MSPSNPNSDPYDHGLISSPLESAEGLLVTAAIRDISVRKNAETHLAQMESRYRGLLEAAPDAMVVVNQGGGIVLLNVQAEKQFGYRRDELLGQQVKNIIPEGFAERLLADGLRSTEDALAQQIGTGNEQPRSKLRGISKQRELMIGVKLVIFIALILDVVSYRRFITMLTHRAGEITIGPKFPSPQLFLDLRTPAKNLPRR